MKKRIISIVCLLVLLVGLMPSAAAADFNDVPSDSWAASYISEVVGLGVMDGYGDGQFGYGSDVKRSEFAAMLVRLFGWELVAPESPSFEDNADKAAWYYDEVETAVYNGAVTTDSKSYRPDDYITREEMAVMLVRALGFESLAGTMKNVDLPFNDVSTNAPYIAMAYDFGIINGLTPTTFGPSDYALREQAAAMMIRLHERYDSKLGWSHAFYAVKAYPQKDLIRDFDAVSFGWSQLEFADSGVRLNTTASGGNGHVIPDGSEEVLQLASDSGAARQLSVFMSALQKVTLADGTVTNPCTAILTDETLRADAVSQITAQLQGGQYTGVTIDFEEMRGDALKDGLNLFLQALKTELDKLGASLYVCVHPVTTDGVYYNAYDYKMIGDLADRVILMAHDYAANTLTQAEMDAGFTATPVSPFYEIYAALKAATDPDTGVGDTSKLALAINFTVIQWKLVDGKVINASSYKPDIDAVYSRMTDPAAVITYSVKYQNPYISYHNDTDNTDNIAWYEDMRSVDIKMELARMFGVTGLSVWRLGMIPDYPDPESQPVYYDFPTWLAGQV